MSENGKTRMVWKVTYLVHQYISTEITASPGDTAEDIEDKHLVAQAVRVHDAQPELIAHLQQIGIAEGDVRIVVVSTKDSVTA